jgi:RNA polymerase sigma-70 factor (ECF subfamily)
MPLNRAQFEELFHAERDRVFRFLYRLSGNAADADDLLQDSFVAAWRNRMQFQARGSSAGWLLRTAFRLYLNARRKRMRREALRGESPPAETPPSSNGFAYGETNGVDDRDAIEFLLPRVREAVDALPEGPREAFVMYRLLDLPVAEIAEIVDAPPKTVETRVRRATQLLGEALAGLKEHLPRT